MFKVIIHNDDEAFEAYYYDNDTAVSALNNFHKEAENLKLRAFLRRIISSL